MKTTAMLLCVIIWIAGSAQNQILLPRVKKADKAKTAGPELKISAPVCEQPVWSVTIHDKQEPVPLNAAENQTLIDEMFKWYDAIKANKIALNFAHKLLFENQLNALVTKVMLSEMDVVKKRYNIAQRWCDSLTRFIGMPSEICMDVLKKSKKGYAACDLLTDEALQFHQPEIRFGMLQNAYEKLHQSTIWQEMAILEIHQYKRFTDVKPVEMMAADDE
jgi:hypothetical protein